MSQIYDDFFNKACCLNFMLCIFSFRSPKKQIPLASDAIFNHYASAIDNNSNKRERSPEPMKKLGLFNALEKSTSVIDFNNLSAGSSSTSVFKWTNNEEPVMRTKKLKVAPPRIMPLSQVNIW